MQSNKSKAMKTLIFVLTFLLVGLDARSQQPCFDPSVIDSNIVCTTIYNPVCGCDGITYVNNCVAYYYYGITSWTTGPCSTSNCVAGFTYQVNGQVVNFLNTSTSSGQILSYYWQFGDGNTSNAANPVYTYAQPGNYLVCLTITATNNCTSTYCDSITIGGSLPCYNPSQIDSSIFCPTVYSPVCGCDSVTYFNACEAYNWYGITSWTNGPCNSVSNCHALYYYQASGNIVSFLDASTASSQIVYWSWSFGDGNTTTVQNPTHTYASPGIYFVCLTAIATDSCVSTYCDSIYVGTSGCINQTQIDTTIACPTVYIPVCGCDSITYNNSCEAYYWYGVTSWTNGPCGGTINCHAQFHVASQGNYFYFTDISTSNAPIVSWYWDFGDGQNSSTQNPTHQYNSGGNFVVCLIITTADSCTSTYCDTVQVGSTNCHALYTVDSIHNLTVSYLDASTGNVVGWLWDFGDGNFSINQHPTHTFLHPGHYLVCLSIITTDSCISTYCDTLALVINGTEISFQNNFITSKIYPNPANGNLHIEFTIPSTEHVKIKISNLTGKIVDELFPGILNAGKHKINWQNSELSPGIYFIEIATGSDKSVSKLILLE